MIRRRGADVGVAATPVALSSLYAPAAPTIAQAVTEQQRMQANVAPMPPPVALSAPQAGPPAMLEQAPLAGRLGASAPLDPGAMRREPGGVAVSVNPFVGAGMPGGMTYAGPAINRAPGAPQMPAAMPERSYAGSKFGGQLSPAQRAYIEQTMSRRPPNTPATAARPVAQVPASVFGGQQQAAPGVALPNQQLPAMQMPTRMR